MKTRIKTLFCAFLFLGFLTTSCCPKVVTLQVDTDRLLADNEKQDFSDYASFKDQEPGESFAEYTTVVKKGRVIKWKGKALNGNDKVNIEMIEVKDGSPVNVFPNNLKEIPYFNIGKDVKKKIVKATPIIVTAGDAKCRYNLYFSIEKNGQIVSDSLVIDPEIEVKGDM